MTMLTRGSTALGAATVLLQLLAGAARAQETGLRAVVEQIAGANLYLSVGAEAGLAAGDTVQVYRDGDEEYLGAFRIVASSSARSVVEFIGEPFAVTRGTTVRLRRDGNRPVPAVERTPAAVRPATAAASQRESARPRVRGRVGLDFSGLQSTTKWVSNDEERVERRFATPSLSIRLDAANLPGGLRFETSGRAYYRHSDPVLVQPEVAVRVYQASISKRFDTFPLEFRLGRFYNSRENYSGYWDGALIRVGGRSFGLGAAAGFQPDRSNQAPSTDLPKYSVFADYAVGNGTVRYATNVSFHQVRPREQWSVHTFAGWSQTLRMGGVRLASDIQVDRDPESDSWKVGRLHVSGAVPLSRRLSVHGRYAHTRPYFLFRTMSSMPFKRDQASGGLFYLSGSMTFGADVTATRFDGGDWGLGYGASFNVLRTGVLGLGLGGSGTYWSLNGGHALQVTGDLARPIGRGEVRLSYQLYRTESTGALLTSHTGGVRATIPLGGRTFATVQFRTQHGANLLSNSLYASLWTTF